MEGTSESGVKERHEQTYGGINENRVFQRRWVSWTKWWDGSECEGIQGSGARAGERAAK